MLLNLYSTQKVETSKLTLASELTLALIPPRRSLPGRVNDQAYISTLNEILDELYTPQDLCVYVKISPGSLTKTALFA